MHVDQSLDGDKCNPTIQDAASMARNKPTCTMKSVSSDGAHCDCAKFEADYHKQGIATDPCVGWVTQAPKVVPCTSQ